MSIPTEINERRLAFQYALNEINYKDWSFFIGVKGEVMYLQVQFLEADNYDSNSAKEIQKGRKWLISQHMTKSELIQTALKAVITAEEHEIRELFTYKGAAIFGPHFDVDELLKFTTGNNTDIRTTIKTEDNGT